MAPNPQLFGLLDRVRNSGLELLALLARALGARGATQPVHGALIGR